MRCVGLGVLLFLSSAGTVQKYAGTAAAVASLLYCSWLAASVVYPYARARTRLDRRQALLAAGVGLLLLPWRCRRVPARKRACSGCCGGPRDAANIGAHRPLGEHPLRALTYLGTRSRDSRCALFAAPFYAALGNSAYANVFWLAVLVALVALVGASLPLGVAVVSTTVVLSPGLLREYLTGGDLIANAVYVALTTVAVYRLSAGRYAGPLAAVALGVALASRANFALIRSLSEQHSSDAKASVAPSCRCSSRLL